MGLKVGRGGDWRWGEEIGGGERIEGRKGGGLEVG